MPDTTIINVRGIPIDLWRRLKLLAVKRGTSAKSELIAAMRRYIREEEREGK